MKYLIIGSEGFIGSACKKYFGRKGEVFGADIQPSEGRTSYYQISGPGSFEKCIQQFQPDVCINASGSANVSFSFENPERDRELNVLNVREILEAIRTSGKRISFINFSSAAVYGNPRSLPVMESAETAPLSPYGKHKLESEHLLKEYALKYQLPVCSLRVFSAYGPGLRKQLFWDVFQKYRSNPVVRLSGNGMETRDFIYIDDLMTAIESVIGSAKMTGETINVASGVETTIAEAAGTLLAALGKPYELVFNGQQRTGDPLHWKAEISTLLSYKFNPKISITDGLNRTAQWLKSIG